MTQAEETVLCSECEVLKLKQEVAWKNPASKKPVCLGCWKSLRLRSEEQRQLRYPEIAAVGGSGNQGE